MSGAANFLLHRGGGGTGQQDAQGWGMGGQHEAQKWGIGGAARRAGVGHGQGSNYGGAWQGKWSGQTCTRCKSWHASWSRCRQDVCARLGMQGSRCRQGVCARLGMPHGVAAARACAPVLACKSCAPSWHARQERSKPGFAGPVGACTRCGQIVWTSWKRLVGQAVQRACRGCVECGRCGPARRLQGQLYQLVQACCLNGALTRHAWCRIRTVVVSDTVTLLRQASRRGCFCVRLNGERERGLFATSWILLSVALRPHELSFSFPCDQVCATALCWLVAARFCPLLPAGTPATATAAAFIPAFPPAAFIPAFPPAEFIPAFPPAAFIPAFPPAAFIPAFPPHVCPSCPASSYLRFPPLPDPLLPAFARRHAGYRYSGHVMAYAYRHIVPESV
eukprot:349740-Chlamydomonas_euryale.AAC.4